MICIFSVPWTYFFTNEQMTPLPAVATCCVDKTGVIPLRGTPFRIAPPGSFNETDLQKKLGARIINERDVYPGPDPDTYVFTRYVTFTNIYRIVLP
jgi:hypothetical protein